MSQVYYWNTPEHGALLLLVLGFLGAIQIFLSFTGTFVYLIVSPIVLTLVPLGVVLAQGAATAVLANLFEVRVFPHQPQRGVAPLSPIRIYLRGFALVLLAMVFVLGIWGGFYVLIFFFSPWTQIAYVVAYIIANTAGAIIALTLVTLFDWLFRR
ncbi:MAG: hypothetical protein ACFFDJ_01660 [Candidatus Odinarchaeota archaeon]